MKGLREGTEYLRTGSVKDSAVEILSFSTSVLSVFTHLFQFFGSGFGLVPLNRFSGSGHQAGKISLTTRLSRQNILN